MRTIIAGSRDIYDSYMLIVEAVKESGFDVTSVISGCARGVDKTAISWAADNMMAWHEYPADWKSWGKIAGLMRNEEMAKNADALIAIWDGKSRGTKDMIERAKKHNLKVFVKQVSGD